MSPQLIIFHTFGHNDLSLHTFIEDTAIVCIKGYSRKKNALLFYWYGEY